MHPRDNAIISHLRGMLINWAAKVAPGMARHRHRLEHFGNGERLGGVTAGKVLRAEL